jgi:glycerophosphoryl diester phosphodiesterase
MTKDGVPVVSHDPTAKRMANVPRAWKDMTLAEARALDMGWGFVGAQGDRPFAGRGVQIATFEEVVTAFPDVAINVDVKQPWPPMAKVMVDLVRRLGAESRVVLASFHWSTLVAIRAHRYGGDTSLSRGEVMALLGFPRALVKRAPLFGTCAQVPTRAGPITLASRGFIDKCHDLGIRVDFWTINDPEEAKRLVALGADGIMTDDPRAVRPAVLPRC